MMSRPITVRDAVIICLVLTLALAIVGTVSAAPPPGSGKQPVIPSGGVMFFNLDTCPGGWTELTDAQGRYLVGLPSGGVLGGQVGTPLSDQENRPVGGHDHDVISFGHTHGISDPGHSHTLIDPGHQHDLYDPGHQHNYSALVYPGVYGDRNGDINFARPAFRSTSNSFTNIVLVKDITGITMDDAPTEISILPEPAYVVVDAEGLVSGTNAPYLQLLVCQKD